MLYFLFIFFNIVY